FFFFFFFSSRRRHTRSLRDWSSDVCSSDLVCSHDRIRTTEDAREQAIAISHLAGVLANQGVRRQKFSALHAHGVRVPDRIIFTGDRKSVRVGKECRCGWAPDHEKKKR